MHYLFVDDHLDMRLWVKKTYAEVMITNITPTPIWFRQFAGDSWISTDVDPLRKESVSVVLQEIFYVGHTIQWIAVGALSMESTNNNKNQFQL